MSMNYNKDILSIISNQNFRESFSLVLSSVTESENSGEIVLDMVETYYSTTPGAGDREMILPRGYTLCVKKRGGFYLKHPVADVLGHNKVLRESVPNFLLYFRSMR